MSPRGAGTREGGSGVRLGLRDSGEHSGSGWVGWGKGGLRGGGQEEKWHISLVFLLCISLEVQIKP